jgi:hypothetical protein
MYNCLFYQNMKSVNIRSIPDNTRHIKIHTRYIQRRMWNALDTARMQIVLHETESNAWVRTICIQLNMGHLT